MDVLSFVDKSVEQGFHDRPWSVEAQLEDFRFTLPAVGKFPEKAVVVDIKYHGGDYKSIQTAGGGAFFNVMPIAGTFGAKAIANAVGKSTGAFLAVSPGVCAYLC